MANNLLESAQAVFPDPDSSVQQALESRKFRSEGSLFDDNSIAGSESQYHISPEIPLPPEPPDPKTDVSDNAVYPVMAGVAFTIVFAFLVMFPAVLEEYLGHWKPMHDAASLIVNGGNPVARGTAELHSYPSPWLPPYVPGTTQICSAAQIVERTYLLLALLLGYLVVKSPDVVKVTKETSLDSIGERASHTNEDTQLVASQPATTGTSNERVPIFECKSCPYTCPELGRLNRHIKEKHEKVRYLCSAPGCQKGFLRKDYREKHELKQHRGPASLPPSLPAALREPPRHFLRRSPWASQESPHRLRGF
ncbi:hypothetical protein PG997_001953 [Apiospora hydei]|uniref:C2H2-type domain-containing protein n=1 Tax=Apiospora hydei TaxID=1337664 RepID=A0ABR1X808_9PEZI